jgi:hypothetical protein
MLAHPRLRWSRLLDGALILLFATMIPAFALRTGLRPDDPLAGVAVVFAPWIAPGEAIARAVAAGASLVRLGGLPSIVVVSPADRGYVDRVFAAGALLALDPKLLAACSPALLPC